jgi:hypothetical protein
LDVIVRNGHYGPEVTEAVHALHAVHGRLQDLAIQHYYDMLAKLPPNKQERLRGLAVKALSTPHRPMDLDLELIEAIAEGDEGALSLLRFAAQEQVHRLAWRYTQTRRTRPKSHPGELCAVCGSTPASTARNPR